jgi:hypothetical protein
MNDTAFYLVRVKEEWLDEKSSKPKAAVKQKLVKAVSITDSEAKVAKLYVGCTFDWSIIGSNLSKIDEIIQ